jgi:hypothetical protein
MPVPVPDPVIGPLGDIPETTVVTLVLTRPLVVIYTIIESHIACIALLSVTTCPVDASTDCFIIEKRP